MRNFPEWPVAFWGAASVGAIVVPLNAWWTGPELEYGLADSGTKVLVADGERMERLADHFAALPGLTTVTVRGDGPLQWTDVLGSVDASVESRPTSTSTRTTRPRSSTRRARRGSPRAPSAPTATSRRTSSPSRSPAPAPPCVPQFWSRRGSLGGSERDQNAGGEPPVGAVLPRDRLPLGAAGRDVGRQQARPDAQVEPGAGPRADRTGAGDELRRRPVDGVAGAAVAGLREAGHVERSRASATAARRRRPSSSARSPSCSPASSRRTATGSPRRRRCRRQQQRHRLPAQARQRRRSRRRRRRQGGGRGGALDQGAQRRDGLLEQAGGDGRGVHGRLAAHRRRRPHRRGGLRLHRRPGQGHDHPRRRERVLRRRSRRRCSSTTR